MRRRSPREFVPAARPPKGFEDVGADELLEHCFEMTGREPMPRRDSLGRHRRGPAVEGHVHHRRQGHQGAGGEELHGRAGSAPLPVEPKPPIPRAVVSSSASTKTARSTRAKTICAIRAPRTIS